MISLLSLLYLSSTSHKSHSKITYTVRFVVLRQSGASPNTTIKINGAYRRVFTSNLWPGPFPVITFCSAIIYSLHTYILCSFTWPGSFFFAGPLWILFLAHLAGSSLHFFSAVAIIFYFPPPLFIHLLSLSLLIYYRRIKPPRLHVC